MPYIIDGNNLVGSSPDIALEDPGAREKLLTIIQQFQEARKSSVTIVFDGAPWGGVRREEASSKLTVLFPREGCTADDEIRDILDGFNYFKDVVLVTSDRALKSFAKNKGARTVNSIEFHFELKRYSHIQSRKTEKKKRIEVQLSDNEVDLWMKIFENPGR